jgi:large subunit ribosomal protein L9
MKVLLIKDVYKLGHAGDIKKVADGFGRNFLLPQGLAVLATAGAIKQSEKIRQQATALRVKLNTEMGEVAKQFVGILLTFTAKAGETGKMYGAITTQDITDALAEKGITVKRNQVDMQPIRTLGDHKARIRLTVDLIPEVKIHVHREGEAVQVETAVEETAPAAE